MRYKNKYNSRKVVVDGIKFDSHKEARRYKELKLLEKAKEIENLELQPKFLIQDKFKYGEKTIRRISYVADFKYTHCRSGKEVVEDVKGYRTDVYKLKKKLFLYRYPEYDFIET